MKPPRLFGSLLAFLISIPAALAQATAQAPASIPPPTPDIITLNPFQVTAADDTGYRANNTLDGSRLNTALRDTPAAISVFTKDLIDDLAVTDIAALVRYDVNSEESHQDAEFSGVGNQAGNIGEGTGSTGNSSGWRTRGLVGSVSIDGFRAIGRTDTYNVESAGSTRGPNAILFGTGAAGGVLNLRTKQANPVRNTNLLEFKIGENSTRRGVLDVNRALVKDKLALRVMGVLEEKGSHQPHQYTDRKGGTVAVQYRFGKDTNFNVSYEDTRTKGVSGRKWPHLDSVTLFLQELNAGRVVWSAARERYETPAGAVVGAAHGVANLSPRTVLVYGPELGMPTLWEGTTPAANRVTLSSATSIFTGNKPIVPESIIPSGLVTSTGGAEYGEVEFTNLTVSFNHRLFDKLFVELAYNQSDRSSDAIIAQNPELRADLNYRLPGGALNPYFFGNGYYFTQGSYLRNIRGNDNETFRAALSYNLDLKKWGQHRFAVMAERHINNEFFNRVREVWAGAPYGGLPEAAANQVSHRRYFQIDGPFANYTPGWNVEGVFHSVIHPSAVVPGRSVTTTWVPPNFRGFDDEVTTDSQLFVMQNYLLNRRLVTTLGLRFDQIETFGPGSVRDPGTQIWRRATPNDTGPFAGVGTSNTWFEASELEATRRSLGAVYHLNDNFSLAANFSNGIQIPERNRTVLPVERVADPYQADGRDYGLHFSFLDNRIAGAIRYYESSSLREGGQEIVQAVFTNPNNDVLASFDYYYRQAGLTGNLGAGAPVSSVEELRTTYFSGADAYLFDQVAKGWEFETVANPTRNWTVRFNYSYTDRTKTNVLTEGEGWWAERVALFSALDRHYTARTGRPSILNQQLFSRNDAFVTNTTVAQRIAESDRELAETRLQEQQGYGNRKHKTNVWTRYSFNEGRLKGLAAGGGWRFQSRNVAGIDLRTGEVLYGNARSLFDAMMQYRTRGVFGLYRDKTNATYQVNITNLLDDRTFFITKMSVDTANGNRYMMRGFRDDPRTATFTMRLAF